MKISKEFARAFFNSPVVVFAVFVFNLFVAWAVGLALGDEVIIFYSTVNFVALILSFTVFSYLFGKIYRRMPNPLKDLIREWNTIEDGRHYVFAVSFSDVSVSEASDVELFMKDVGLRIRTTLRASDEMFRDGDLYFARLAGISSVEQVKVICHRLDRNLSTRYSISGTDFTVQAHVGACELGTKRAEDAVGRAENLSIRAKMKNMPYMVQEFSKETVSSQQIRTINRGIRDAVACDDFTLRFHPKIDLVSNDVVGFEALLRWNHGSLGELTPKQFLKHLDHDLQSSITRLVMKKTVESKRTMELHGIDVPISINFFASDIARAETMTDLITVLAENMLSPESVMIEVGELSILDSHDDITKILVSFDALGVRISLDDFHLTQLSYVFDTKLPISEIKIDQRTILEMLERPGGHDELKGIVDIARNYGTSVIAEKIDDGGLTGILLEAGIRTAQGYHFAHPLTINEVCARYEVTS